MGIARSPLSKKRETSQWEAPFLSFPPFQIRSVRRLARIAFALLGPSTKRTASAMFDFPEPFGPVTDVYTRLSTVWSRYRSTQGRSRGKSRFTYLPIWYSWIFSTDRMLNRAFV